MLPKKASVRMKAFAYSLIGAVVAIGLLYAAIITQTNNNAATGSPQELLQETTEIMPNEVSFRTGIPTLTSFETSYSESIDYYQIEEGQYTYLERAIQKGTTLISEAEMDEYFKTFSDKGYNFAVALKDGTKGYYAINYFEPPISLDKHNILLSIKDDVSASAKALPTENVAYLSEAIERPFRWVQIDDTAALSLNKVTAEDGNTFNISTDEGEKTVRMMYLGPYSEELKLPEFQAMYGLTTTGTGGQ